MSGHWQKEIPSKSGPYWTATRDGLDGGIKVVSYNDNGQLVYAGGSDMQTCWKGWWWSEPVDVPAPPAADEWNTHSTGEQLEWNW